MDRAPLSPFRPGPGGVGARVSAVLLVGAAAAALLAATVTGPWWYTWRAWGLVSLGALAGAAAAWAVAPPRPRVTTSGAASSERPGGPASADRHRVVEALVDLLDAVPTESLRYRVHRALSDAGVSEFGADGELFDPTRHHVQDVEWTDDPGRESRVARTLRPGFTDGADVVRAAEVLVYRTTRTRSAGVSGRRDR